MPPKPFNPPIPRKSITPKARGRPKGSESSKSKSKALPKPSRSKKSKELAAISVSPPPDEDHDDLMQNDSDDDDPFASNLGKSDTDMEIVGEVRRAPAARSRTAMGEVRRGRDGEGEDGDGEGDREEEDEEEEKSKIPNDLLTKIIHEMFKEDRSRLSKEASKAVGKYFDTFVREAVARVRYAGGGDGGGGWWEVEDLEKIAPQLLLDF